MNQEALIQYYIQQEMEKRKNQLGNENPMAKIGRLATNANSFGDGFSATGNFLKDNVNNKFTQKIGSNMVNWGGNISNGANAVSSAINTPSNYFKGVADRNIGQGMSKIGSSLAEHSGVIGKIGQQLLNKGAVTSGVSAAGGAAGTTGASAAAAGTATGAGTAAGGAAAGGSAASGATAAGPIGALVGLGIMALQGTNRKRAKQGGEQLMNATNQMAQDRQRNNLEAAQQNAEALQQESQQSLMNGAMTGAAAPIQENNAIADYQNYLRQNGYSDEVINGVPQGLNYGNSDIADWINQYNAGAGQNSPIKIPQTNEEIAAAKAGTFNNPVQNGGAVENVKQGLLDKFISGVSDFSIGFDENRNTTFRPENLSQDRFITNAPTQSQTTIYKDKSKMARLGEGFGTVARALNRPGVQGLIAGGLSAALTGDPLYGLSQGYKFANRRAMNDVYTDFLKQYGINIPESGMFGNLDGNDMKNIGNMAETRAWHDYLNKKSEKDLNIKQQNADSRAKDAQTRANKQKYGTTVTHVSTGNAGNKPAPKTYKGISKNTNNAEYNQNLAKYMTIVSSGDSAKIEMAKKGMTAQYGSKFLTDSKKLESRKATLLSDWEH